MTALGTYWPFLLLVPTALTVVVLVVSLVAKALLGRARAAAARRARHAERFDAQGRPLPPFAAGLCDYCQKPFDKVYYLEGGYRACEACFGNVARRQLRGEPWQPPT
jgi:hypothetical protein